MLAFVLERLKEPSSYAGLAGVLAAMHIAQSGEVATAVTAMMVGAASLAAIFLKEKAH